MGHDFQIVLPIKTDAEASLRLSGGPALLFASAGRAMQSSASLRPTLVGPSALSVPAAGYYFHFYALAGVVTSKLLHPRFHWSKDQERRSGQRCRTPSVPLARRRIRPGWSACLNHAEGGVSSDSRKWRPIKYYCSFTHSVVAAKKIGPLLKWLDQKITEGEFNSPPRKQFEIVIVNGQQKSDSWIVRVFH